MLDKQGFQTFFNNIHELWIKPELDQRFGENIPNEFQIRECLIKLPKEINVNVKPPIYEDKCLRKFGRHTQRAAF